MSRDRRTFPDDKIDSALMFISAHAKQHGCAPSMREIGKAVGYSSPSTVHLLVQNMFVRGYVDMYQNTPRSISLTADGYARISVSHKHPLHGEILNLLPAAMAFWSQELFAARWMSGLDRELPKMIPEIAEAAKTVGRIPTYFDGDTAEWRNYPEDGE